MEKLKHFAYLFLALLFITSCEKEIVIEPEILDVETSKDMTFEEKLEFYNIDLKSLDKNLSSRVDQSGAPIYSELCEQTNTGVAPVGNIFGDPVNWEYYTFSGLENDAITIWADTPDDLAMSLYFGVTDDTIDLTYNTGGNNMLYITYDDDSGPGLDPLIAITLPYTGDYTLAVGGWASDRSNPYTIITTGINCNDSDGDGVLNENDLCANTPNGETVNENGCAESQLDDDNDGIFNTNDQCANTPSGEDVNENGCGQSQLDSDNDGIMNNKDAHPYSDISEKINIGGCYPNVDNKMVKNGSTMMDQINDLIAETNSQYNGENYDDLHKRFMTKLAGITYNWKMVRLITATQRTKISSCAWGANIPYNMDR